ncbi:MAG: ParB/RepB/Spo0J family partition protein, partial [Candidatus Competibacter sp.]
MTAAILQLSPVVPTAATSATAPLTPFDGQLAYLPLDWIEVQPGFNPRTFFEDGEFAALVESVKVQGILQAIWVRPQENYDPVSPRFWLIAGERRWRAARAASLPCIPVTVRVADARQALILADLENNPALRINLSVAEEAQFAQRFLGECDGDRAEAARLLGWSRARLDARLLLL